MQINNKFILIDNYFASIKEYIIKLAMIIIKNKKYLTSTYFLKFNGIEIKLKLNIIILIKKSYVRKIFLVIDNIADYTSFRAII